MELALANAVAALSSSFCRRVYCASIAASRVLIAPSNDFLSVVY
jgi:hypothetical protein